MCLPSKCFTFGTCCTVLFDSCTVKTSKIWIVLISIKLYKSFLTLKKTWGVVWIYAYPPPRKRLWVDMHVHFFQGHLTVHSSSFPVLGRISTIQDKQYSTNTDKLRQNGTVRQMNDPLLVNLSELIEKKI